MTTKSEIALTLVASTNAAPVGVDVDMDRVGARVSQLEDWVVRLNHPVRKRK